MEHPFHYDEKEIMRRAGLINPLLTNFLTNSDFAQAWSRMRSNVKDENTLIQQFKCWFDGFKTLKLINYLSREYYYPVNMFTALDTLLKMQKIAVPEYISATNTPELVAQGKILQYLRMIT
ncbi:MAG: hypothetical protein L7F78_16500 [Syntrophales bacterium LBB04]|nr:hypothetical protein [Syntrophales bacterium LBB04]